MEQFDDYKPQHTEKQLGFTRVEAHSHQREEKRSKSFSLLPAHNKSNQYSAALINSSRTTIKGNSEHDMTFSANIIR